MRAEVCMDIDYSYPLRGCIRHRVVGGGWWVVSGGWWAVVVGGPAVAALQCFGEGITKPRRDEGWRGRVGGEEGSSWSVSLQCTPQISFGNTHRPRGAVGRRPQRLKGGGGGEGRKTTVAPADVVSQAGSGPTGWIQCQHTNRGAGGGGGLTGWQPDLCGLGPAGWVRRVRASAQEPVQ